MVLSSTQVSSSIPIKNNKKTVEPYKVSFPPSLSSENYSKDTAFLSNSSANSSQNQNSPFDNIKNSISSSISKISETFGSLSDSIKKSTTNNKNERPSIPTSFFISISSEGENKSKRRNSILGNSLKNIAKHMRFSQKVSTEMINNLQKHINLLDNKIKQLEESIEKSKESITSSEDKIKQLEKKAKPERGFYYNNTKNEQESLYNRSRSTNLLTTFAYGRFRESSTKIEKHKNTIANIDKKLNDNEKSHDEMYNKIPKLASLIKELDNTKNKSDEEIKKYETYVQKEIPQTIERLRRQGKEAELIGKYDELQRERGELQREREEEEKRLAFVKGHHKDLENKYEKYSNDRAYYKKMIKHDEDFKKAVESEATIKKEEQKLKKNENLLIKMLSKKEALENRLQSFQEQEAGQAVKSASRD